MSANNPSASVLDYDAGGLQHLGLFDSSGVLMQDYSSIPSSPSRQCLVHVRSPSSLFVIRNQRLSELQPKHHMFITSCNCGGRVHYAPLEE